MFLWGGTNVTAHHKERCEKYLGNRMNHMKKREGIVEMCGGGNNGLAVGHERESGKQEV